MIRFPRAVSFAGTIDTKLLIIILVSVLTPILIVGIVFLVFHLSRRRYVSLAKKQRQQYNDTHMQLTADCKGMVGRLGALGKYSDQYNVLYLERNKQYDDLLSKRDQDMAVSLDSLDALISEKNFKSVKEVCSQTQVSLEAYIKAVSDFGEDLSALLRDDSDTREGSLGVKEKYRKVRDFYSRNATVLKPLERSFDVLFQNAEKVFIEYDTLTDKAEYDKAKKLLPPLDDTLRYVIDIMNDLPTFVSLSQVVIPEKLTKLEADYQSLVQQGYVLDYLAVEANIKNMHDELGSISEQLVGLDISGVKDKLDSMQARITDILVQFDNERNAKVAFNKSQDTILTSTYELERQYSRLMNQMPDYRKTYTLDKRYVDQMSSLKNDIEAISFLKRDLDSYIDTSNKQPYTVVYKKVTDLQREIRKVDQTMQDYSTYLDSLKTKSQEIYVGLRNYYLKLKKAQYQMKNQIGVDSFIESEGPTFKTLYDEIATLDTLLITQPVDVPKASEEFAPFVAQCDELVSIIEKKSIECKNAETAIVYANAYRVEYTDSRPLLDTAEKAFNEGDFDRALENALSVIKSFSAQQQNTAATTQP